MSTLKDNSDTKVFSADGSGSSDSGYGKDAIGGGHTIAAKSSSSGTVNSASSSKGLGSDDDSGDANPSSNVGVGSSSKGITSA